MNPHLIFLHALSPLHVGTGRGVGVIDLPIARERATSLPIVPGSSLKGVLRAASDEGDRSTRFGDAENAGQIAVSDLRLLLLPVRSLRGTFAWVTSPFILRRLAREVENAGGKLSAKVPTPPTLSEKSAECYVASHSALRADKLVVLEDLDLTATSSDTVTDWAEWLARSLFPKDHEWRDVLTERLCIVPDDVMTFLATSATEVAARIRLAEESKTVARGGLWYEEALPAETVLSGLLLAQPRDGSDGKTLLEGVRRLADKPLQLGGDATVGRGLCRLRVGEV